MVVKFWFEPEGMFPPKGQGRLPGLDGNAKMSKSLNNAIYLSDDADTYIKKLCPCILIQNILKLAIQDILRVMLYLLI